MTPTRRVERAVRKIFPAAQCQTRAIHRHAYAPFAPGKGAMHTRDGIMQRQAVVEIAPRD